MYQKISTEQTISMQLCPGIYPVMQLCTNPQTEGHSFTWDVILFYIIQDKFVHNKDQSKQLNKFNKIKSIDMY